MYVLIGFYKDDGTYITAKSMPISLYAGETENIVFSTNIPEGTAKTKIMTIGKNMKLYSYKELEIK